MSNAYLIVSDLHLADVEDHPDGWKRYKSSQFVYDCDLAELVERALADLAPDAHLTLILNGDILDFDVITAFPDPAPFPVSRSERRLGLEPTLAKSIWKADRILEHHPVFLRTLAELAAAGHTIVYVLGNHDRELHFPEVRGRVQRAVGEAAQEAGLTLPEAEPIRFEPWFYVVPNEVYAEHGQQYDRFSSWPHLLTPTVEDGDGQEIIAIPMGNLACRYLLNAMGTFNPHAEDFRLSFFSYLAHWVRNYVVKGRSLVLSWVLGGFLVATGSFRNGRRMRRQGPASHLARRREYAAQAGLPLDVVAGIDELRAPPITERRFRLVRELWFDRVALAAAMTGATLALALLSIPLWIKLMVPLAVFPFLFLGYEALAEEAELAKSDLAASRARTIAGLTGTRVVVFGHTHDPMIIPLARGLTFVNTGTWAPTFRDTDLEVDQGTQNFALVDFGAGSDGPAVRIGSWTVSGSPSRDPVAPAVEAEAESGRPREMITSA